MSKPLGFNVALPLSFDAAVTRGACVSPLAFDAISADPSVGLLLPCNVTVEWISDSRTGVRLTDPEALLSTVILQGAPELTSVARDARNRMQRIADSLSSADVREGGALICVRDCGTMTTPYRRDRAETGR